MITKEPLFIDCPFAEKEEAKRLGAQFNWREKKWFIPPGLEIEPFAQWLPVDLVSDRTDVNKKSMTLNELMLSIQTTITTHHNTRYWIRTEVISITAHSHIYMELSDYDSQGNENAKVRATLWNHRAKQLFQHFETHTGMPFKSGFKVLLQVRVEFHPFYGLSLDILDIDPSFTLGELEAKLNRIRTQLQQEGIYKNNQSIAKAEEFYKIAVIVPPQAAGLGDFKSQANVLVTFGLCQFYYYYASFQGQLAQQEIPAAMEQIHQDHLLQQYDAIVMIRGGGAKADLYQLNEYEIVKAVCTASIPVIVGIGHERDQTLLDEVANYACHTPSLVITHIGNTVIQNARDAQQHWQTLIQLASNRLNQAKVEHEQLNAQIREQTLQLLGKQRQQLNNLIQTISNSSQHQINQARYEIMKLMEQILRNDPKKILAQGYVVVRNHHYRVITHLAAARQETSLILEFKDGHLLCLPVID